MTEPVMTTRKQAMQIAALIAGALVTFNTGFYLLSDLYFGEVTADIGAVRGAFAILTAVVAAASFAAALAPRLIGHGIAIVLGLLSIVAGIEAFAHELPGVMCMTLLVVGVLTPVLAWMSLNHSRSAWSFLIAVTAVFAAVDFFGAPKIRGLLGIGLWTALIIPGLQTVTVIALTMLRSEYRERR